MKKKKVLLIGSGGREHALASKLSQSPELGALFIAPGNPGTEKLGQNISIKATDLEGLLQFALAEKIDLTIVGPDDPLALGIVDLFQKNNLRIFGPTRAAAQIEASKVFAKQLMQSFAVPTAPFIVFNNPDEALDLAQRHFSRSSKQLVIKADGLALGKGVYVCHSYPEAQTAIDEIMVKRLHGSAGNQILIERFVDGQEVSMHAFCDGRSFELFPEAQDHKPVFDGDKGPNTGGMGTICPVPWFVESNIVSAKVVVPILGGLHSKGSPFVGCLYPGLKLGGTDGINVLEFNARFGDPETQVYMCKLKTDILPIFEACIDGTLDTIKVEWHPGYAVCIVLASSGYPSPDYKKGDVITGIENAEQLPGVIVFHAGTKRQDGQLITSSGRVLGVTATGTSLQEALALAYKGVDCIHFAGMHCRRDIGKKSLEYLKN